MIRIIDAKNIFILMISVFLFTSCTENKKENQIDKYAYNLGVVGGFSELIAAGVKQLALSPTLSKEEMDVFIIEAEEIAAKHGVSVFRESDLIVTDLFPADIAEGLDVLLLFKGTTKEDYIALKEDQAKLKQSSLYTDENRREISRRFGRMLSYSPKKINALLAQNTSYRTLSDFGIQANNLFLYYRDLKKAGDFYSNTLGFEIVADYEMAIILRMSTDSYLILVDASKGMHTAEEPKTVALALLTNQLDAWYEYLKSENVVFKFPYKGIKEGSAHDGFVIVDPEGYLLEVENFNQHQENEKFVPLLVENNRTAPQLGGNVPEGLRFHSTITWLYHKDVLAMEKFYQNVLGLEMVADQGWTKIYQVSKTGFMAIVDEKRGMHKYSVKKAVNIGFILKDVAPWFEYAKKHQPFELRDGTLGEDSELRYKAFVGYGPEGYYYEFDTFLPHDENSKLMRYLSDKNE